MSKAITQAPLAARLPVGDGVPGGTLSKLVLPAKVPRQAYRPAQSDIPDEKAVRAHLKDVARLYARSVGLVPPLTMDELREHTAAVLQHAGVSEHYADYTAVLVSNASWADALAQIPYEKRLLLLPKCLRVESKCPAPFDEFGLLCKECGLCSIQDLSVEAERLGYAVLVAEGSAIVQRMIETGKIEAVVGVSCLNVLEKCFPHMEAAAIPSVAIPLLQDDCINTTVDLDWVWELIHLTADDKTHRLDLDSLKEEVRGWFTRSALDELLGPCTSETDEIARYWLAKEGKRWRPYLAACTYMALEGTHHDTPPPLSLALRQVAVAIECFHKASLVHDDIEDGDEQRYGDATLHSERGVPIALNVGDFLIGLGYQLLAEVDADPAVKVEMLRLAAQSHQMLSRGQGMELCWAEKRTVLSSMEILEIFRMKTAPAFEVALRLGACLGRADDEIHEVLRKYSEALGLAYQIADDIEDHGDEGDSHDIHAIRPSLILAIAHKRAPEGAQQDQIAALWRGEVDYAEVRDDVRRLLEERGIIGKAEELLDAYKEEAVRSLRYLPNATLKGLLRRVVGKIFSEQLIEGYCSEFEARNATGRAAGTQFIGEAAPRVAEFFQSQFHPDGGVTDRAGQRDLYYTVFGLEGLMALRVPIPEVQTREFLCSFGDGGKLDFVHAACLARCWACLPYERMTSDAACALAAHIETCRSADGGYAAHAGAQRGTVYHCFLAQGLYEDLGLTLPDAPELLKCVAGLRTKDGAFANEPHLPMGTTPSTAAAITLLRKLGESVPREAGQWLLDRAHPHGGFTAVRGIDVPDLLSTATALHALSGMHLPFDHLKEPCLDFIDTLWTGKAFCGSWVDDAEDCEYTYYALLALGHLSL